jgi:hypothetical protein
MFNPRFAGPGLGMAPQNMPYVSRRFAGQAAKADPDLVHRITSNISISPLTDTDAHRASHGEQGRMHGSHRGEGRFEQGRPDVATSSAYAAQPVAVETSEKSVTFDRYGRPMHRLD